MFTQRWREHFGLAEDPFACEDADKDHVLAGVDAAAVHSAFDRVLGSPSMPAPAVVFGEKGSGKSGFRRMLRRRLEAAGKAGTARPLVVEYVEFDRYLSGVRRARRISGEGRKAAEQVVERFGLCEHADALLSLATTRLVETLLAGRPEAPDARALGPKERRELLLLAALYHDSERRTAAQAVAGLRKVLGGRAWRAARGPALCALSLAAGAALALLPVLGPYELPRSAWWLFSCAVLALGGCAAAGAAKLGLAARARRAVRAVSVLPRDPRLLARVLAGMRRADLSEHVLPAPGDGETRYALLGRLVAVLQALGYSGLTALVDRVDEPALFGSDPAAMRRFVEPLLDIKLLQLPGLAVKLFLPIELEGLHRAAAPEALKRMRLDKANLVPELKWTGEELVAIADERLRACTADGREPARLERLLDDGVDPRHLRETLAALATPRYAFGFLSAVLLEHAREQPEGIPESDARWRVSRSAFDVARAQWLDRTGVMRRALN